MPESVACFRSAAKNHLHFCSITCMNKNPMLPNPIFLTPCINYFIAVTKVFVKKNGAVLSRCVE